ncbi:MAG TPA: xanthine dehydrogenase family protein molybdopterin-binding subunit [Stellaceae bacterium]
MPIPFKGRREDFRLVTGQGRYTADWNLPDQAYGHFLRADRAHAEIRSIDIDSAHAMPGVLAVLIGEDYAKAGYKTVPPMVQYPGKDGMKLRNPKRPVLAVGRVRHVGEEVALVIAETPEQAQDAAEAIAVDYRDLPAVVDAEDAAAAGAPQLHEDVPGNVIFDYEYGNAAATEAAFAGAAHVVTLTLHAQRIVGNPMEPKACLATYDAATDMYEVYAPSQGMSMMQGGLSAVSGVPVPQIRAHAYDVGGGFGIRGGAYAEYSALMLAAKIVGRPVKWVSTRSETFLSDYHARAARMTGELALDQDGIFLAVRYRWLADLGAYPTPVAPFINTLAATSQAVNLYRIPTVYGLHRLVVTNTTPTTAYRGATRPNVSYIMERLVGEASRVTGIDPVEIRRRNVLAKEAFPYKNPVGSQFDSGDPPGLLDDLVAAADVAGFPARRADTERRGKLRGMGVAMFIEPSGGGGPKEEVAIKFGSNGDASLYSQSGPSGQGNETAYPEIVAGVFGIDPEQVTLRVGDAEQAPLIGMGSIGSRSLMSHGSALLVAAREVVKKGMELAAKDLEVSSSDIVFEEGKYRVVGTDLAVGFSEIARKYGASPERPLDVKTGIPSPMAFPSGAHVCEVEIDPETGTLELVSYVAVDDCGNQINPTLVAGQVHGGIMQGIGQAIGEHCVYDRETGQLLNGSFMDYFMPHAFDLPAMALYDHPMPTPNNPLGAKGAGEAGTTGAVPTLANAVHDALSSLGIHHIDMPYSPHRLWQAIHAANGKGA